MRRTHITLGILGAILGAQIVVTGFLALLLYQVTPNQTLASQTFIGRVPGLLALIRAADRIPNVFYRGPAASEPLPHYALKVDPEDLAKVEDALPKDRPSPWYGNVFLTDDAKVWVPATFSADGTDYDVTIRVRGDIFNHWFYRKKSWRVKFEKDDLFQGKRQINLIIPEDRGWIAEPTNVYRASQFDLLHPETRFVSVSLNGSAPLLYTEIEHLTKEMLEKAGRPGDVNFYNAGGGTSHFQQWDALFTDAAYFDTYTEDTFGPGTHEEIIELHRLSQEGAHKDPNYLSRLETIVDRDRLVAWYAHSLLSGSRHVRDHNLRLFFDVSRGRFEPIPWDTALYGPRTLFSLPGNPFLNEAFRVPELKLRAYLLVWEYLSNEDQVEALLLHAKNLRSNIERIAYRDPLKLPSNRTVKRALNEKEHLLRKNLDFLEEELSIAEVLVNQRIPTSAESNQGVLLHLDLTVRGVSPVAFSGASLPSELRPGLENGTIRLLRNEQEVPFVLLSKPDKEDRSVIRITDPSLGLLSPGDPVLDGEVIVDIPHTRYVYTLVSTDPGQQIPDDAFPIKLRLRNAVTGKKADVLGEAVIDERTFERLEEASLDRDTFINNHPIFFAGNDNEIVLQRGLVNIRETIIIPRGLQVIIKEGTTIRLSPDVSILSYSPVEIGGTEENPVIFKSLEGPPWGVFAVLNAESESRVSYAEFENGGEDRLNGAYFSGMASFYGSPVVVRNSAFRRANGDDGLNIKYVYADIMDCTFEENSFDGLDVDVAPAGEVLKSKFINNGNDGLDISWSPIVIRDVETRGNGDKCISVGERSAPTIEDTVLEGCIMGLAAKDGSEVLVKNAHFLDNETAIAAYIKKPIFPAPSVSVFDSFFVNNAEEISTGTGATVVVEGGE